MSIYYLLLLELLQKKIMKSVILSYSFLDLCMQWKQEIQAPCMQINFSSLSSAK